MTCTARHWYAVGVSTGVRSPHCTRCGDPNPNITAEQVAEYEEYMAGLAEERRWSALSPAQRRHAQAGQWIATAYRQLANGRASSFDTHFALALAAIGAPDPGRPLDIVYREKGLIR